MSMRRLIGPKPLGRHRVNGGEWVVSTRRRYGIRRTDGLVVWYDEGDPRVRAHLAIRKR